LRHVSDRGRRETTGQSSAACARRGRGCGRRARADRPWRARRRRSHHLHRRGVSSRRWTPALGVPRRGGGAADWRARETQSCEPQPGHRWADGVRLVRHGPDVSVNAGERGDAYDPKTGAFLWHVGGTNQFPIPSPTFHDGIVYLSRGYRSGPYMAIRPGGHGDISTSHVVWQVPTGAPYISSLVYDAGVIYMANDVGAITAVEAATGAKLWQERVNGIFSASPVAADGKIYLVSETGGT